jgi:tetratricopeptide (TPR) repeat protein
MFMQNPLLGVGMDRYGAYFKQFRDVKYPLSYGFDITSSNAHNTFIQLFATGGVFLGASYLILNGYILKRAIFGLRNQSKNNQLLLAGVFSAWIGFHAQSLVSIDNIGISIWGWVLGGSIIGLSLSPIVEAGEERKQFLVKQNSINLSRASISGIFGLIAIILVSLLYRGESNTFIARSAYNLDSEAARANYREIQLKSINTALNDPSYALSCAVNLFEKGYVNEGIDVVKKIYIDDPRNLDAITTLALMYENLDKIPDAIEYRLKISELDPWNAVNYLQLGKDYKLQGDQTKSNEMLEKIISFSTGVVGGPIAEQAKKELLP